jgi:hypothetical protein
MEKRIAVVCSLLLALGGVASAAVIWTGTTYGGDGSTWNDPLNWSDTVDNNVHRVPLSTESADIGNVGGVAQTVTINTAAVSNLLRLAPAAADDVTLVLNNNAYSLTVIGTAQEVLAVGKVGKGVVNQSAGVVRASSTGTNGGEIRVTTSASGSRYNLSGGSLDTGCIRKNAQADAGNGLYDTGGTIVVRTILFRIGPNPATNPPPLSTTVIAWTQGASLLAPGSIGQIGVFNIGSGSYEQAQITTDSSVIEIDLASDASYDVMRGSGNAYTADGELRIKATYTPAINTTFDVWKLDLKTVKTGTGIFDSITDNLPGYFTGAWLDLDAVPDGKTETLRLTYLPEPATLSVLALGLGGLLIRRKRS